MLLTTQTLQRAVEVFLKEAHIPRPKYWSVDHDVLFLNNVIVPAFYKALQEIEEVQPCFGFDLNNVKPNRRKA
jgi:hypothetical protein